MKSKTRKRLVRFLLIPVIVLVVLIGVAFTILLTQQQRLVKLAIKEFNKKLPGTISIDGSNISFDNFPYISIRLNKCKIRFEVFLAE